MQLPLLEGDRVEYDVTSGNTASNIKREVVPEPYPPVIDSFTAAPNPISSGENTTLSYTTTGADSASIDQGVGYLPQLSNGSVEVTPDDTASYTITAGNNAGNSSKSITARVF